MSVTMTIWNLPHGVRSKNLTMATETLEYVMGQNGHNLV